MIESYFISLAFVMSAALLFLDYYPMYAKWAFGSYIVPALCPTVVACDAENHSLAPVYTLKTLLKRRDNVRIGLFFAHVCTAYAVAEFLFGLGPLAVTLSMIVWPRKRPVAVLVEATPNTETIVSIEAYEEILQKNLAPVVTERTRSRWLGGREDGEKVKRALRLSGYDVDEAVRLLSHSPEKVNEVAMDEDGNVEKDEGGNPIFVWSHDVPEKTRQVYRAYTEKPVEDKHVQAAQQQQGAFARDFYRIADACGVPRNSYVVVSGDPVQHTPIAGRARAPERTVEAEEATANDKVLQTYEEWYDCNAYGARCMAIFSYGPLSTIAYGANASPEMNVFLFAHAWSSWGQRCPRVATSPTNAFRTTLNASLCMCVTDVDFVTYNGFVVKDCIESVEEEHGRMPEHLRERLSLLSTRGTSPLYDAGALRLPSLTSAKILLHPFNLFCSSLRKGLFTQVKLVNNDDGASLEEVWVKAMSNMYATLAIDDEETKRTVNNLLSCKGIVFEEDDDEGADNEEDDDADADNEEESESSEEEETTSNVSEVSSDGGVVHVG